MKKAVVICMLAVVLASMWSSVACASPTEPEHDYWVQVYSSNHEKVLHLESDEPLYLMHKAIDPTYFDRLVHIPYDITVYKWELPEGTYSTNSGIVVGRLEDGTYFIDSNYVVRNGITDEVVFAPHPWQGISLDIVSPMDLAQDNAIRWEITSLLTINDVGGDFDKTKLSYALEVYMGPLYTDMEIVTVPFGVKTEQYFNQTVEDRVVHKSTLWFEPPVGRGKARIICEYDGNVVAAAEVRYRRYSGYVDENGDGLDDRTGQPDHSKEPLYEPEIEMPEKPEGGNIIDWVIYVGELIAYVFEMVLKALRDFAANVLDGITAVLGLAQPMFAFVAQFFASMPAPMSAAVVAMVSISTAMAILKLIRG